MACTSGVTECKGVDRVYNCVPKSSTSLGTVGGYSYEVSVEPSMPVGLQPNGEACTKPTSDAPNNCEGINGCSYYNYTDDGQRFGSSSCTSNAECGSSATCSGGLCIGKNGLGYNDGVANCTSESKETNIKPAGCVYYANGLVNCLPSGSLAGIPEDCRIVKNGENITADCRDITTTSTSSIHGLGCVFRPNGSIHCTSDKTVIGGIPRVYSGCIYTPDPENGISCPGVVSVPAAANEYVNCVLSSTSVGSVSSPVTACFDDGTCPNPSDVCLNGSCVSVCTASVTGSCDIGKTCTAPCPTGTLWDSTTSSCVSVNWFTLPECKGAYLKDAPTGTPFSIVKNLIVGTTQIYAGLTTDENVDCKYSTNANDTFNSVTMTLFSANGGTTGGLIHETLLQGLNPLPTVNNYLVRCKDPVSGDETPACKLSVKVGTPCSTSLDCKVGVCLATGYCGYPACSGAVPSPRTILPAGTTSTIISMKTDLPAAPAVCRYSNDSSLVYSAMTNVFSTSDNINHSSGVTGLVTGYNAYYVQCEDLNPSVITGLKALSRKCTIAFKVGGAGSAGGGGGSCVAGTYTCPNGVLCPTNGKCPPGGGSCVAGTYTCPNGVLCPTNGKCPPTPTPQSCPLGTAWDPFTATCVPVIGPTTTSGGTVCNVLGIKFQGTAPESGIGPSSNCSILAVILAIVQWFAWLVAMIAVIYGLRGGYLYITSGGNETKLAESRKSIMYTVIGVIVAIVSFGIVAIARAIAGI